MEILLQFILLALGFVLLAKGADWFVEGAAGIATKFGIPQLVIGLTIVAMGTSAPEAAVSIAAALKGNADITIGNIVGSNILNILIILGMRRQLLLWP
ncbi:MAG: sodium:calcium antiporter [Phascolarctobacterium sp.]